MRLADKFKQLKKEKKKAFIAYVPFGFPSRGQTLDICLSLERAGADIIELGIPFSDPLADGPIIQAATTKALAKGANLDNFFLTLTQLKKHLTVPIVIMAYYNPIYRYGLSKFFIKIKAQGVSAVTFVDVPVEESKDYLGLARKYQIDTIFFVTPTTSHERIKKIVKASRGFVYYISVTGITGPKSFQYKRLTQHVEKTRKLAKIPVCVGFGIHKKEQIMRINKFSDGVIVGSSIVKFIEKHHKDKKFLKKLQNYIRSLCPR